jgi:hypothetical protein
MVLAASLIDSQAERPGITPVGMTTLAPLALTLGATSMVRSVRQECSERTR